MEKDQINMTILKLVSKTFSFMSEPHRKNLAGVLSAFFYSKKFSLRDFSSYLPGESSVKHKLKRLKYFFDTVKFSDDFWKSFVKTIFCLPYFKLRRRKYITLALDATTLKDDFWILAVSITFCGRSIPIYIKMWKDVNVSYNYWERVKEVVKKLKKILPKNFKYEIVADRGFQGEEMFSLLKEEGLDFIVRINGAYSAKTSEGNMFIQLPLFDNGMYRDVTLGKTNPTSDLNLAITSKIGEDGEEKKWYLATTREGYEETIDTYATRFWIEESFKDLKSVLGWETYTKKVPQKKYMEGMVILSCLSYALQISIGGGIPVSESEEDKTSVLARLRHVLNGTKELAKNSIFKFLALFSSSWYRVRLVY